MNQHSHPLQEPHWKSGSWIHLVIGGRQHTSLVAKGGRSPPPLRVEDFSLNCLSTLGITCEETAIFHHVAWLRLHSRMTTGCLS